MPMRDLISESSTTRISLRVSPLSSNWPSSSRFRAIPRTRLSIRFGVRALRLGATVRDELARGGKLLATAAWATWVWLVVELSYRQLYLGWATLFGNLGRSLAWSAAVVALAIALERLVPWPRAPRGVRHLGGTGYCARRLIRPAPSDLL